MKINPEYALPQIITLNLLQVIMKKQMYLYLMIKMGMVSLIKMISVMKNLKNLKIMDYIDYLMEKNGQIIWKKFLHL